MTNTPEAPSPNDPSKRLVPDEPYFTLAARDPLAPYLVRLYGALRRRDLGLADQIFKNARAQAGFLPYHPMRDPKHGREASEIANAMELWLVGETQAKLQSVAMPQGLITTDGIRGTDGATNEGEPQMSDPEGQAPKTYDNTWLIPYLAAIAAAGEPGLDAELSEAVFRKVFQGIAADGQEYIGAAKIRQTCYIAKLAKKIDGALVLTDAGRALIATDGGAVPGQ